MQWTIYYIKPDLTVRPYKIFCDQCDVLFGDGCNIISQTYAREIMMNIVLRFTMYPSQFDCSSCMQHFDTTNCFNIHQITPMILVAKNNSLVIITTKAA